MSHQQQHHASRGDVAASTPRAPFAAPRLELPRFQLRTSGAAAAPAAPAPATAPVPAPAPRQVPPQFATPMPGMQTYPAVAPPPHHWTPAASPTNVPQPVQVTYAAAHAAATPAYGAMPAPAPAPHATLPPRATPAPRAATPTRTPTTISWDRVEAAHGSPGLLQRITPVHMGVLLMLVMVASVVSSGPAAMKTKPVRLPALADGGGHVGHGAAPRAGATATGAAAGAGPPAVTPRAKVTAPAGQPRLKRPRLLRVGSATLNPNIQHGGIPSPAAAANLAIRGGGRAGAATTGSLQLDGMPSAAASEQLGPRSLPYRPSDGVTMPRGGEERDNHAVERHYAPAPLAMDEPVAQPAMTPGQAAANAELQVIRNDLGSSGGIAPAGGAIRAY